MARTIDQIRASKLPSNMMQFAARGALQVPAAENIEILVHLALHNRLFGDLARMTLAGWDEKSSLAAAADPQTTQEVLNYFISFDNLRPKLLPVLLENPSIAEGQLVKLARSALRDIVEVMLRSQRAASFASVRDALTSNPYLRKDEAEELRKLSLPTPGTTPPAESPTAVQDPAPSNVEVTASMLSATGSIAESSDAPGGAEPSGPEEEKAVATYMKENAEAIAAEAHKPFQAIGGVVELLGSAYFPVLDSAVISPPEPAASEAVTPAATPKPALVQMKPKDPAKRENTLQKISGLDVKGRIQLALKGNKEERSILIRDGTKVVALAVLEAPKLSDGEVQKIAGQKNVLEAVLRQIPLKRRFMKDYIVVRNLVGNPRTPLDIGLGLMKNLLAQDLKNLSNNKDVSETIRKLALKMYKQKLEAANKK